MKYRKCAALALLLVAVWMILTSCTRTIRSPADELTMFSWSAQFENGDHAALSFDEHVATFRVQNDAFTTTISGEYLIDEEQLVISDTKTKMNYRFSYIVHGDCVDLSFGDGTISLEKI